MGLAASQARLLTITSRKSDCEYESMNLSHQKIALARDMNIVSAEYQDALTQTKLVYDFYGSGDKSTQLSYSLLMSPSKLNNYFPSPVTDPSGRIVLDSKLAAAAKAAGIPQEGLGCTPSSDVRNRFIDGLMENGLVTRNVANSVKSITYNPGIGLGGSADPITTSTRTVTFDEFVEEFLSDTKINLAELTLDAGGSHLKLVDHTQPTMRYDAELEPTEYQNQDPERPTRLEPIVSIKELLLGDYALYGTTWDMDQLAPYGGRGCIVDKVGSSSYWDFLFDTLYDTLPASDNISQAAVEYAKNQVLQKVVSYSESLGSKNTDFGFDVSNAAYRKYSDSAKQKYVEDEAHDLSSSYVGFVYIDNRNGSEDYNDGYNINLTNITKAFYTYFAMYMEGLADTDYKVTREKSTSKFVTDFPYGSDFAFEIEEEVDASGDNVLIAQFYDALFNQIATKGWVENTQVNDNDYMATMMKNGCMYISTISDDGYYYQASYATNPYVKEITDEEGIAVAEAKYSREKEKINAKENILDMKLKNLDTEISSLSTEYDSVKNIISNNVKSCFTRYKA